MEQQKETLEPSNSDAESVGDKATILTTQTSHTCPNPREASEF